VFRAAPEEDDHGCGGGLSLRSAIFRYSGCMISCSSFQSGSVPSALYRGGFPEVRSFTSVCCR
jgi:hypothetical protein